MRIAGLHKNSFIDYPGKVCAVLFTPGCNMDCFYCHNRGLLDEGYSEILDNEDIFKMLKGRKGFLDGVVLSGGEPTLQKGLLEFTKEVKDLGYAVKLDTNGTNPEVVEELINGRLVDYIAMDVKAPFKRYKEICRTDVELGKLNKSIDLLMKSGIEYEFRTTLAPGLEYQDIFTIAEQIKGAKLYVLQKYRSVANGNKEDAFRGVSLGEKTVVHMISRIKCLVERVETRGIAFCA